jgi:hypothetical protein
LSGGLGCGLRCGSPRCCSGRFGGSQRSAIGQHLDFLARCDQAGLRRAKRFQPCVPFHQFERFFEQLPHFDVGAAFGEHTNRTLGKRALG